MSLTVTNTGTANTTANAFGFTATAGRLLVAALSSREFGVIYTPGSGWSILAKRDNNPGGEVNVWLAAKLASGGETAVGGSMSGGDAVIGIAELTDATTAGYIDGGNSQAGSGTPTAPALTPSAGLFGIALGALSTHGSNVTGGTGWTGIGGNFPPQSQSDWPRCALVYQIVNGASGSYTPVAAGAAGTDWAACSAFIYAGTQPARGSSIIIAARRLEELARRRLDGLTVRRPVPAMAA